MHEPKPFVQRLRDLPAMTWDWFTKPSPCETKPCVTMPDFPVFTVLDLHGMTIAQAHEVAVGYINDCYWEGVREVTIITGRSGEIRREFPTWMKLHERVRSMDPVNEGSFRVKLTPRR